MERRRILLRLSVALNAVLIALSVYVAYGNVHSQSSAWALTRSANTQQQQPIGAGLDPASMFDAEAEAAEGDDEGVVAGAAKDEDCKVPTEPCNICTAGLAGKALCKQFGQDAMTRMIAYSGTNHRLRRSLAKMRAGQPFTFAALGGSVSAGHGLRTHNDIYDKTNMHTLLFDYLNQTFPAADGSITMAGRNGKQVNAYVNGAQPARGSDYFSMCSRLHIPEDADLIVVELAINDPPHPHSAKMFEFLLRALHAYKNQPGILLFNVFALMFQYIAMGGDLNHGITQHYDIPTLSSRNALLPLVQDDPSQLLKWFSHNYGKTPTLENNLDGLDLRHFSPYMHNISAEMMKAYIDLQLCEMDKLEEKAGKGWKIDDLYPVPPLPDSLIMSQFKFNGKVPELHPFCMGTNSEEYPLKSTSQDGWRDWEWKDKKYLVADKPGSTISFEFSTTSGDLYVYFLRSWEFGLGTLACEIEDRPNSRKLLVGYWTEKMNIGRTEHWGGLPKGKHLLKCELLAESDDPKGGTEFRLMSLMSI